MATFKCLCGNLYDNTQDTKDSDWIHAGMCSQCMAKTEKIFFLDHYGTLGTKIRLNHDGRTGKIILALHNEEDGVHTSLTETELYNLEISIHNFLTNQIMRKSYPEGKIK